LLCNEVPSNLIFSIHFISSSYYIISHSFQSYYSINSSLHLPINFDFYYANLFHINHMEFQNLRDTHTPKSYLISLLFAYLIILPNNSNPLNLNYSIKAAILIFIFQFYLFNPKLNRMDLNCLSLPSFLFISNTLFILLDIPSLHQILFHFFHNSFLDCSFDLSQRDLVITNLNYPNSLFNQMILYHYPILINHFLKWISF